MKIRENNFTQTHIAADPEPRSASDQRGRQVERSNLAYPYGLKPLESTLARQQSPTQSIAPKAVLKRDATIGFKSPLDFTSKTAAGERTGRGDSIPSFGGWFGKKKNSGSAGSSSSNNINTAPIELPLFNLTHVPFVSQGNDQNGCWYACAQMIGHSVEAGPRLGVPALYAPEWGHDRLDLRHAEEFIENERLSVVDLPDSREFSHEDLGALLYQHGPVIFGWQTPQGNWHMSVLTGVDKNTDRVVFHDPHKGPGITMPLSYFNERLAWNAPHAMLYRRTE